MSVYTGKPGGKVMKRTQSDNLKTPTKPGPIIDAASDLLRQAVPGDTQGRTFSEVIAATLVGRALRGDLRAVRELVEITTQPYECPVCRINNHLPRMSDEELELNIETYLERRARSGRPWQQPLYFPELTA